MVIPGEATGNAAAVAEVLSPHVGRVVIANPRQVRLIAYAKIKTDAIDAAVLAKLYATGFCPRCGCQMSKHWPFAGRWHVALSLCGNGLD